MNWQIIDTAPKDGTRIKLLCPKGEDYGFFDTEWSTERGNGTPILWAPTDSNGDRK
jgi:hypothetical protein